MNRQRKEGRSENLKVTIVVYAVQQDTGNVIMVSDFLSKIIWKRLRTKVKKRT